MLKDKTPTVLLREAGGLEIAHQVRTDCAEWKRSDYLDNGFGMMQIAYSYDHSKSVETSWCRSYDKKLRFETLVGVIGLVAVRDSYEDAIKAHDKWAATIIEQLDEIDAHKDAYGSALLDGIL